MRAPAHVLFAVLALVWGTNFVTMKWASATLSAGQISLLRVLFGFLPVAAYAWSKGAFARSHIRHAHHFVVMSVLATSGHYFAFAAGTALLPSGIAGALAGLVPLFSLMAAVAFLPGERPGRAGIAGLLVGLGGVVLIARPWESGGAVSMAGVLWMALGSATVGLSFVYAKRFLVGRDIEPAALTTYQFGIALITLVAVTDLDGVTAIAGDPQALAGLVIGLGLLGSGLAYILYYVIVDRLGAVTAASSTYLPPVVALAIGWLLVGETIAPVDGLAALLILAGVVTSAARRRASVAAVDAAGRAGDAVPGLGEQRELGRREVLEEVAAHALEVGDRRGREPRTAVVGEVGICAAGVVRARDALDEPVALQPVDEPRQPATAQQHRLGDVAHAHLATVGAL